MRVLVCGGRSYANKLKVWSVLNRLLEEHGNLTVIQACEMHGVETAARVWCNRAKRNKACRDKVTLIEAEADWEKLGSLAWMVRNSAMVVELRPELVVAFPGWEADRWAADVVRRARKAGLDVRGIE